MITGFYSREQLAYRGTTLSISVQDMVKAASLPESAQQSMGDQVELSEASRSMAMDYNVQEFNFSAQWNESINNQEHGIVANASYAVDYSQKIESLKMDFTFSAESLGLSKKDFEANGGKPIELQIDFAQQSVDYLRERSLTVSQPNRKAHEVLADIAKGLQTVFSKKGDKNVRLHLDHEAVQSLLQDAKSTELMDDIVALITIINQIRLHQGKPDQYDIYVSGKGKLTVDYHDKLKVNISGSSVSLHITIQPPEETVAEPAAAEVPASTDADATLQA